MEIKGLTWLGVRTSRYDEMVAFFRELLGLELESEEDGAAVLLLGDGAKVEIFGPTEKDHDFFTTGPVIGFEVDDLEVARTELERAGVEFIGDIQSEGPHRWSHFRGPDGNVYELTASSGG